MSEHTNLFAHQSTVRSWSVDIDIDPEWYELKGTLADRACPQSSEVPLLRSQLTERTTLIGRHVDSSSVQPGVSIATDRGVSRRHAQFVYDADQLTVVDLSSTNGTYVIDAGCRPTASAVPLMPGVPVVLQHGDQVFVGAWSRLTVRAKR